MYARIEIGSDEIGSPSGQSKYFDPFSGLQTPGIRHRLQLSLGRNLGHFCALCAIVTEAGKRELLPNLAGVMRSLMPYSRLVSSQYVLQATKRRRITLR
jgi:hypothetical protein